MNGAASITRLPTIGNQGDLLARLKASAADQDSPRPYALLLGAGVTRGSVPGVDEMVAAVRNQLDADDAIELDVRLSDAPDSAERYRRTFAFLALRKPPYFSDRVIQVSVLRAYKGPLGVSSPLGATELLQYETDVDAWNLTPGVESIGRIWSGLPPELRGPIITTNFDPLIEVSIGRAGSAMVQDLMDADGTFLKNGRQTTMPQVVHIHGFWRSASTSNTGPELSLERPVLDASLRQLLRDHTVIVAGYGAWNDVFTRQLVQTIREQNARDLDVLWCFYEPEDLINLELPTNDVLGQLLRAPGNIQFYSAIDSNEFFPELERTLADHLQFSEGARSEERGRLVGWIPVKPELGAADGRPQTVADALSFFDGRLPNWSDAGSTRIARRELPTTLTERIARAIGRGASTIDIVTGASGEGKSTCVMQIGLDLASRHPEATVLFSAGGRFPSAREVLGLPADTPHVLIVDDCYTSIERIKELATAVSSAARGHLHLLLASRDSDWSSVGGFTYAWNRYLPTEVHRLKGISRPDAVAIVDSWERLGPGALGALGETSGHENRVTALLESAADEIRQNVDGAFLGALLRTRYGPGLVDHVRELLVRLSDRAIYSPRSSTEASLLEAFYLVALPHALGVTSVTPSFLGRCLGLMDGEVHGAVLLPLGDEAAIGFTDDLVLVRHRSIAEAAMTVAEDIGVDLSAIAGQLVTSAVEQINSDGISPRLHPLAYLSQSIGSSNLAVLNDPQLGTASAHAAVAACANRLSYRTSLSRALRRAHDYPAAVRTSEDSLSVLMRADDASSGSRPVFVEWSITEGLLGHSARSVVLAGVGLQDLDLLGRISTSHAATGAACMTHALRDIWTARREYVYLAGLAASVALCATLDLSESQQRWTADANALCFREGARPPHDLAKAAADLEAACRSAIQHLEAPLPPTMPPLRFRFESLRRLSERQ